MFSTVAGASKSKTPSFVEPIASRIAKKTDNYYYNKLFSCVNEGESPFYDRNVQNSVK